MLLEFTRFAGANLALHPLLLPDGQGVASVNCNPERGDLRPLKAPDTVASVATTTTTIYRMGRTAPSDTDYWLAWDDDVDVARGFVADDTAERTFWTGDGVPKWTDNSIGLGAPPYPDTSGVRLLGVPKPNATPSLTETVAGTGTDETRAYVVVWVNDRGELSMPSTAATITCKPGATIQITRNATVPTGAYGLATWRVYRTIAGNDEDYFYVGETTAATATLNDTGSVNTADPLPSEDWDMPPSDLKGLKVLWGGMMVGFRGKELCFCEPLYPFAWPARYRIALDADIVGIARMGLMLVVLTVDQPYILTGSSPEAMSPQVVEFRQACLSKRGIVELGHGVAWPSPDGLAFVGIDGARRLLTDALATRDDWQALSPDTMIGVADEGELLLSYGAAGTRETLIFDPANPAQGLRFCDVGFAAAYRDPIADALYVLADDASGDVQRWDDGTALTATFKSRVIRTSRPTNFACAQILADDYPVTFSLWAGGTLIVDGVEIDDGDNFRLPAGFLADQWQFQIETIYPVQQVLLAHSAEELRSA